MYLHIGNGKSIKEEDIVGIFDLDTATVSGITKKFVTAREKAGLVEYTDYDLPRAFVVMSEKGKSEKRKKSPIKLSRISAQGLVLRSEDGLKAE